MKSGMKTNVYVFQTSVKSTEEIQFMKVSNVYPRLDVGTSIWTTLSSGFFRIEAETNISNTVISLFNRFNYRCLELIPDDCD